MICANLFRRCLSIPKNRLVEVTETVVNMHVMINRKNDSSIHLSYNK